ncbi:flagellar basal-body rod protein FlgF [Sneathiella sp. HT1-7]|jgi:flagellar basal-body rod protein FlgF|uniref:flagellar basal-body rod protein FlgF n=1 Tax=Sneathiella sp. HT1-7 TaxID=2887192 RepID=UPI001D14442D|nr:flagellar basal-body rod protein FlgF [Sneathiella sp. HT1-7]MCC3305046.1 flagellar basal-body rod protein FlgF [Sneathiella sp. HT1-7]
MENAVFIGLSQQMALKRRLDMTANNLANVNTTAFKSEHPLFEEFLVERANQDDVSYVQDYGSYRDLREGEFTHTGRPLDLAISGEGYFSIETAEGIRYTRNGSFRLDPDGNVVTINNEALLDENNRKITIDLQFQEVSIAPDGTVTTAPGQTAKIGLVNFENPQILKQVGNGLYDAEDFRPEAAVDVNIMQRTLEKSNVQPILEMTAMIDIMRAYQSAQQLLDSEHDLQMKTIEEMPTLQ